MDIINLSAQNSILSQYLAEIRNKDIQTDRLRFRRNIERIGEIMAYEISKTLNYQTEDIQTPLGTATVHVPKDHVVIATILRAGLPFHHGFLNYFDHAENASKPKARPLASTSLPSSPANKLLNTSKRHSLPPRRTCGALPSTLPSTTIPTSFQAWGMQATWPTGKRNKRPMLPQTKNTEQHGISRNPKQDS